MDLTERRQAQQLLAWEKSALERIGGAESLREVLNGLMIGLEEQSPGSLYTIMLLEPDRIHLRHGAAPSLPKSYVQAFDGLLVGPRAGSCGAAVFLNRQVIVSDALKDPLWSGLGGEFSGRAGEFSQREAEFSGQGGEFGDRKAEVAAVGLLRDMGASALRWQGYICARRWPLQIRRSLRQPFLWRYRRNRQKHRFVVGGANGGVEMDVCTLGSSPNSINSPSSSWRCCSLIERRGCRERNSPNGAPNAPLRARNKALPDASH